MVSTGSRAATNLKPITGFPPGFSVFLAGFGFLFQDLYTASRILNAVLMGINLILTAWLIHRYTGSWLAASLGEALILLSTTQVNLHAWVMSEPLYITASLVFFVCLTVYLEGRSLVVLGSGRRGCCDWHPHTLCRPLDGRRGRLGRSWCLGGYRLESASETLRCLASSAWRLFCSGPSAMPPWLERGWIDNWHFMPSIQNLSDCLWPTSARGLFPMKFRCRRWSGPPWPLGSPSEAWGYSSGLLAAGGLSGAENANPWRSPGPDWRVPCHGH